MHGRPSPTTIPAFLAGGATGALIAAHDWSATPLGPIDGWPQSLKTTVALMLRSPVPMVLLWGEDGVMLYNDAYSVFAGGRHPKLLGSKVREGWPEVADFNDNVMRVGLAGGTLAYKDQELTLYRKGSPEQVWMNLDYSPVLDEAGEPAGVLAIVVETTERVAAERRREAAEAALRAERDRLASVLCGMGEGFALLDRGFRILDINPEALRLETRPREAIVGRTHWEAYPGSEDAELGRLYKKAMAERTPVSLEHRYVWEDGRAAWLDMRAYPVEDGLAVFYRDVTERKEAEEALRESEARLRALADNLPSGMVYQIVMRADGGERRFVYVSQSSERLAGVSPEAALADPGALYDIILPEHRATLAAAEQASIEARAPFDHEAAFRRADGAVRWGRIISAPRSMPDGSLVWDGVFIDITERKAVEERLRKSEQRFRAAVDAVQGVLWTNDASGRMTGQQPAWAALTGQSFKEYQGYGWADAVHPDDVQPTLDAWNEAVAARKNFVFEHRVRRRDGQWRLFSIQAIPVRDTDGSVIEWVGVHTDITERRAAEAALRESEAHYRHAAELNPQVAWTANPDGQLDRVAERWRMWTGTSGLGESWGQGLHPDDLGYTAEAWRRSVTTGVPYDVEHRVRRLSGEYRWARSRAFPRRDDEGRIVKWYGSTEDVHEQKLAQERLREESRTLETLNRTGAALAGELDLERVVQMVTDAGVELTGAAFGAFFYNVLNDAGESYMLYTLSGVERSAFESFGMPRATAVFQPTFKGEGVIRSDDILADPRYGRNAPYRGMPEGHLPVRSYLAVPVASHSGEVIGGLFFGHPEPSRFSERHERLMVGLAAQAAITIDNARLFQAAQRELAERRRTEEELRASEAQFRMLADSMENLAWMADASGWIFWYNRRWYDYTGTTSADMEGWGWQSVHDPEALPAVLERWTSSIASGEPFEMMFPLKGADGVFRPFLTRAQPVRDEAGRIVRWFGTNTDVSDLERLVRERTAELEAANERLRAEMEERQRAEEQLRQAQKMEAVGQLTGGIAHDFNNLLTGVIGSLDMMQRRIAKGETDRIERYASAAMTSANRAAALTHRLLAFSRRQPLDPKPVNANRLVTGMEELLRRTIGEAIRLEIVTAGGLWQTLCDPHQLESALLNLAINARDAMPEGGTLTIETCNAYLDNAYAAKSREVRPGQYVCICVSDTGTGMPPDVIAKAFDPFFTTKPIGQGTGLGLSMIYGFTRQSDGYAKIYSELGQGTTVKLYLPRYYGEAEDAEAAQDALTEAHRAEHGEVVLVVEDETAVRDLVVDVLQELGYRAVEASDGPSGLKLLQSDMRLDLLVTDVGLPGLNGRQLADAARQHRPDLKVLFMTGYAGNATIANGFLEPGMQMITKPFAIEALATRIRDMIEEP